MSGTEKGQNRLICRYQKDLPANMKYEWIDYRVLTIFPLTTNLPCSSRFRSLSINIDSLMFNSCDRWDIDAGEFESDLKNGI